MLVEELFAECDEIIDKIVGHEIVRSLAGYGKLDKNTLIAVSEQLYVQDYYFLVYGYGSAKSYQIDITSGGELNEKTREHLGKHRNPFTSSSVKRLLDLMKKRGILIDVGANAVTQDYILFELEKAFSSLTDLVLCQLACAAVFQAIGITIKYSPYQEEGGSEFDERLAELVGIYTATVETDYLETLIGICNEMLENVPQSKEEQLRRTFREGCEKELYFLDSLL